MNKHLEELIELSKLDKSIDDFTPLIETAQKKVARRATKRDEIVERIAEINISIEKANETVSSYEAQIKALNEQMILGVAKEKEIQLDIALQSGKPAEIAEKMVSGRMKKFTGEISLTGQPFIKDPSMLVADLLKSKGADVINFVRFEVGEGIEKKEEDFAAEVAAQMAAVKK